MSLKVWREVTDLAQQELAALGFRRWSRSIYNIGLNAETEGMVLLGRVDESGRLPDVYVDVSIGVRNRAIESLLYEIVGEKRRQRHEETLRGLRNKDRRELEEELRQEEWKFGNEPTIISSLYELKPGKHYKRWLFRQSRDHVPRMREMLAEVSTYGRPFMEAHSSLEAIAEALTDMQRSDSVRLAYQAPIAYYLLGQHSKAKELLESEVAKTDAMLHQDPEATEDPNYRYFVAEMLRRMDQGVDRGPA